MMDELRAGREALAQHIIDGILTDLSALGAAAALENEIERQGKINEYIYALARIVLDPWREGDDAPFELFSQDVWLMIRATPEQRARAFLEAVRYE